MKGEKLPFENWLDLYLLFLFLFEEFSLKFLHLNQIFSMYIYIYIYTLYETVYLESNWQV